MNQATTCFTLAMLVCFGGMFVHPATPGRARMPELRTISSPASSSSPVLRMIRSPGPSAAPTEPPPAVGEGVRLNRARQVQWDPDRSIITASGDVEARSGNFTMRADTVVYNRRSKVMVARGKVHLEAPGRFDEARGRFFQIQTETNELRAGWTAGEFTPWNFVAASAHGDADTEVTLNRVVLTTDPIDHRHYDFRASTVYFYPGDQLVAYHVFISVASVPVFYTPYLSFDLRQKQSRWEIRPGHSSRNGMMLDVNYHYLMERDRKPVTGTIYTNMTETQSPGLGADVNYDKGNDHAYLFGFVTRRNPFIIAPTGEEIRADTEQTLWNLRGELNHRFSDSPWSVKGDVDWIGESRFVQSLTVASPIRAANDRTIDASVVRNGTQSIFRADFEREDRARNKAAAEFRTIQDRVRMRYDLYPTTLPFGGGHWFYRTSSTVENSLNRLDRKVWDLNTQHSLQRTLNWSTWFGQSFRFGYRHRFEEQSPNNGFNSIGAYQFILRNSFRFIHGISFDLNYNLDQRINNQDQVLFDLADRTNLREDDGRVEHNVSWNFRWSQQRLFTFLRGGYDLREARGMTIDSQDRWLPLQLNMNAQLAPYWSWTQFARYSLSQQTLQQLNSEWKFRFTRRMRFDLGWDFNESEPDDFSEIDTRFMWKLPGDQWRFGTELTYDLASNEFDESRYMLFRRLHHWNLRLYYRELEDRETQFWFTLNLRFYPKVRIGTGSEFGDEFSFLQGN